jgi:glycosyltransferase involved in cell wall biosynthesis
MPKKKILHIIQSLGNGGCENMLLRTLPLLTDKFEHRIIALREPGELAPRFKEKGIPVTTIRQKGFLDFPAYRRLLSETRQFGPDLVVTNLLHADMIGRLYLQRFLSCKTISYIGTTYNFPRYWPARLFERFTKHLVDGYLANSLSVKNAYVEFGASEDRITVIPNGIDTAYFDGIVPDPNLRKSLGITPDAFIIICVANLHPNKGHRYLLEAFERLHTTDNTVIPIRRLSDEESQPKKSLKLLLVGDGVERKNLERQSAHYQSKESILFLGRRTDVPQLLAISDCFVLPTFFEGMSNAIMEAMASGLPIVTTDIPENREILTHEQTGILCPVGSVDCLARSIERLLDEGGLAHALGSDARRIIQEHYDLPAIAERFGTFFASLSKDR